MKLKQATVLDLVFSAAGLLIVIGLVEIRPPFTPTVLLLQGLLAAAAVTVLFLIHRRVG